MTKRISTFKIKEFPMDGRIWRIAWFGRLETNFNAASEPTIDVVLVPVKSDSSISKSELNSNSSYQHSATKIIRVGTGLFPILRIGSLWLNGIEQDSQNAYKNKNISDLFISNTTSFISDFSANKNPEDDSQIVLNISSHYPEVKNFLLGKILVVDWRDNEYSDPNSKLIIPCAEIFRFYYGRSSQLTRALLQGELETPANGIYDPDLSKCVNGEGFIKLRQTIPDPDAKVVARLAFSEYANKQARNIYHNLIKHKANSNYFILEARPPFEARTNLKVTGKWVMSDKTWHFLVFLIEKCSGPFPFESLNHKRDNDGRSKGNNEGKPTAWKNAPRHFVKTKKDQNVENVITHEAEPYINLELTELEVDDEDCFTDLIGKPIRKMEKDESLFQAADTTFIPHESSNEFSTGAGSSVDTKIEPLAVVSRRNSANRESQGPEQKQRQILPAGIEPFVDTINELTNITGITCRSLQIDFDSGVPVTEYCSFFPISSDTSINPWAYLDYDNDVRRRVMLCEVRFYQYYFYYCDIEIDESDPNDRYQMFAINMGNFQQLSEAKLKRVIYICAKNHGHWLNNNEITELNRKKFKHNMKDAARYANRFYNHMVAVLIEAGINIDKLQGNNLDNGHDFPDGNGSPNPNKVA